MLIFHSRSRGTRVAALLICTIVCVVTLAPVRADGQADLANIDAGRPLRTQDAIVLERYAFEAHLPTFKLLKTAHAPFELAFEPELAIGILTRTQLDLGLSIASRRRISEAAQVGGGLVHGTLYDDRQIHVDDMHARVLHQLNVETLQLPAFAIGGEVGLPLGLNGHSPVWGATAAATRTWRGVRAHVNARLSSPRVAVLDAEPPSPWELGFAVDRTLPLRHLLIGAEAVAQRQDGDVRSVVWHTGAGVRWRWTMRSSLDVGVGRALNSTRQWNLSLGMSTTFGIRSFTRGYR